MTLPVAICYANEVIATQRWCYLL